MREWSGNSLMRFSESDCPPMWEIVWCLSWPKDSRVLGSTKKQDKYLSRRKKLERYWTRFWIEAIETAMSKKGMKWKHIDGVNCRLGDQVLRVKRNQKKYEILRSRKYEFIYEQKLSLW